MADENINLKILIDTANSAKSVKEIRDSMKELKAASLKVGEGTEDFRKLTDAAGQMKDRMDDLNATIKYFSNDVKNLQGLTNIAQGIAGGFAIAQGSMALFGAESKNVEKALLKVQSAMAILQGIESVTNILQKDSAATLFLTNTLRKITIRLYGEQAIAEAAEAVAANTATTAQIRLNAAMKANPIGILITLILAGVAALTLWSSSTDNVSAAEKKENEEKKKNIALLKAQQEARNKQNEYLATELTSYYLISEQLKKSNPNSAERLKLINDINKTYGTTIQNLKDEKQFQEQVTTSVDDYIKMLKLKYVVQSNQTAIADNLKYQYSLENQLAKEQAALNASIEARKQAGYQDTGRDLRIALELQYKVVDQLTADLNAAKIRLIGYTTATLDANAKLDASTIHTADVKVDSDKKVVKSNEDKNKAIEDANIKAAEREAKIQELYAKGITDAEDIRIALMADGFEKETALLRREEKKKADEITNGAIEIHKILQQAEIDKLKLSKTYISDTKDAKYKSQQDEIKDRVVSNQQLIDLDIVNNKSLLLLQADYAKKHQELSSKYLGTDYLKVIRDNATYEQTILNQKYKDGILSGLQYKTATEKLVEDLKVIESEFGKNPDNAFKTLFTIQPGNKTLDSIEKQAKAIKTSVFRTNAEIVQMETDKNLLIAEEQVKGNEQVDAYIKKNEESTAEYIELTKTQWIDFYTELASSITTFITTINSQLTAGRLSVLEDEKAASLKIFDEQKNAYWNLQDEKTNAEQFKFDKDKEFADARIALEQDFDDKKKEIEYKAAVRNYEASLLQGTVNAAGAILKAGEQGGPGLMAITAILTLLQLAIQAANPPQKYATGGLIMGAGNGTSDSIPAYLSNGESVINAKSTKMFLPILSQINEAGGGVPLMNLPKMATGGMVNTINNNVDTSRLEQMFSSYFSQTIKAYVVSSEMTNKQNSDNVLKQRTSF